MQYSSFPNWLSVNLLICNGQNCYLLLLFATMFLLTVNTVLMHSGWLWVWYNYEQAGMRVFAGGGGDSGLWTKGDSDHGCHIIYRNRNT